MSTEDRYRAALERRDQQYRLLAALARELVAAEDVLGVTGTAGRFTLEVSGARSAAVFIGGPGPLEPIWFAGPHSARLGDAALLQLDEPLVREAWESGRIVESGSLQLDSDRLFPDERTAVAIPVGKLGVLYAGKQDPGGFSAIETQLLSVIADQTALALKAASRREAEARATTENARVRGELEGWVASLEVFLEGACRMSATLEEEQVLTQMEALLERLLPHESRVFVRGHSSDFEVLRAKPAEASLDPALFEALCERGVPLVLDEVEKTRFRALLPGQSSLLVVPLRTEDDITGALAVGSKTLAYTRRQTDLLGLVVLHAGASLRSAQLHRETVDAYGKLEESEAQLIQSSKLAAVGQLAAGVAHELNTPLGTVLLEVESLALDLEHIPPDEARLSLEKAAREVVRAREIVEKLLYYPRDAGKGRQLVDLDQVVVDTLDLIGVQLRGAGVEVEHRRARAPSVQANANELQQVVMNLLLNARDALARGVQPKVEIRVGVEAGGVVLDIRDNGPGVPADIVERVFDPFFTTKAVGRGTGLGLSVSRRIAEAHGGSLSLMPTDVGACFRVILPEGEA